MTREEYKKNLIRMWDSIRNNHKGEETCDGMDCCDCPFNEEVCRADGIKGVLFHSYEAIEVVERWAKEHPIVTNFDKFREVFGTVPSKDACVNANKLCKECECFIDYRCNVRNRFWNAEYNGGEAE